MYIISALAFKLNSTVLVMKEKFPGICKLI